MTGVQTCALPISRKEKEALNMVADWFALLRIQEIGSDRAPATLARREPCSVKLGGVDRTAYSPAGCNGTLQFFIRERDSNWELIF